MIMPLNVTSSRYECSACSVLPYKLSFCSGLIAVEYIRWIAVKLATRTTYAVGVVVGRVFFRLAGLGAAGSVAFRARLAPNRLPGSPSELWWLRRCWLTPAT